MNTGNDVPQHAQHPLDQETVRRAKQNLLDTGLLDCPNGLSEVPDVIERSWRRCIGEQVPTRPASIPYRDADSQPSLREAAAPVLARLSEHLAGVRVALFLSDDSGQIIMRRANEPRQRSVLDNACAAEGFDYSEGSVGTNGLGTVLAERRPVAVRGCEHYNDALEPLTCAGTPIFEPFSRRIVGTFALTCNAADSNPLMYAIATDVGRQIENNLTGMLGTRERALIQAYLAANRTANEPVVVVNERTAFANTAGLRYLDSESHALLWSHLQETPRRHGPHRTHVPLSGGWHGALVEQVDGHNGTQPAYCVRLLRPQGDGSPATASSSRKRPARHSPDTARSTEPVHPVPDIEHQFAVAVRNGECLAVDGKPGAGKRHTARAVLARHFDGGTPLILDISTYQPDDGPTWYRAAAEALAAGRGVILRHLQDLGMRDVGRVKAIAERSGAAEIPLVVTTDLDGAPEHVHCLVHQIATTVRVPALAEMPDRIPRLVTDVLARMPGIEGTARFSSEALQLMMNRRWPGNVAELCRVVEGLARRKPGGTVNVGDLPANTQRTARQRQPALMETAERDAILSALRQANGNRTAAAQVLGIGRTTLYRKIKAHQLTP